jgi:hypothetical protein
MAMPARKAAIPQARRIQLGVEAGDGECQIFVAFGHKFERWEVLHGSVMLAHFPMDQQPAALGYGRRLFEVGPNQC